MKGKMVKDVRIIIQEWIRRREYHTCIYCRVNTLHRVQSTFVQHYITLEHEHNHKRLQSPTYGRCVQKHCYVAGTWLKQFADLHVLYIEHAIHAHVAKIQGVI